MSVILVGTDHGLQQSVFQGDKTKAWLPRNGGRRYRKLLAYCINKFAVKALLEETVYDLKKHSIREAFMYTTILQSLRKHGCVLAVVGYVHLGALARMFEIRQIPVHAFLFTYPLVIDETRS